MPAAPQGTAFLRDRRPEAASGAPTWGRDVEARREGLVVTEAEVGIAFGSRMERDRRHKSTKTPGPMVARILGEIVLFDKASRKATSALGWPRDRSTGDSIELASTAPTDHKRLGQPQARRAALAKQRAAKFSKDRPMAAGIGVFIPVRNAELILIELMNAATKVQIIESVLVAEQLN